MAELLQRILEECEGRFVSGQDIGRRLGMSRAAVWKQVQGLRRRGYGIEGARGAGYRLLGRPDALEKRELLSCLARPEFWKSFHFHSETDSTNSRASELAGKNAPHGTLVWADAQTAGRGRLGRKWESPPGTNLYFSILVRPPLEPSRASALTLVTAVALATAVEKTTSLCAGLKWPNDLYLGGKKTAGILAEATGDPDRLTHVVIGVGLNVNADIESFPEYLRDRATSLRIEAGKVFRRVTVLGRFLDSFVECYEEFLSSGFGAMLPEWNRRDILKGKKVTLRLGDRETRGMAAGVDDSGMLLFRRETAGKAERIPSGEILEFGS